MIQKKTVINYLNAIQKFCRNRGECTPKRCPLCTGQCYPYNCLLYGSQPDMWEIPNMGGKEE